MALAKKKFSEVPSDAIVLSEEEAIKYHHNLLMTWKTPSDVFAYRYGSAFLTAGTILTSAYINNHFRRKFKLGSYGQYSSYLPVCLIPAAMSFILHQQMVIRDLILLKQEQCPVCIELRSAVIQSIFGVIWPVMLSPVACATLANRYSTYPLPHVVQKPLELLKVVAKMARPLKNVLFTFFLGHALLGSAVTYFEAGSLYKVATKLNEMDKQYKAETM